MAASGPCNVIADETTICRQIEQTNLRPDLLGPRIARLQILGSDINAFVLFLFFQALPQECID